MKALSYTVGFVILWNIWLCLSLLSINAIIYLDEKLTKRRKENEKKNN